VVLLLRWTCVSAEEDPILENKCTPEKFVMFPDGWPKILDAQVYWFGEDNQAERATGIASRFYDPAKKTMIFIDGFNGLYHVRSCHRMTSKCVPLARCEPGSDHIADPWVQQGWNFGIFFWDQLADEDCYYDAEMKVWGYVSGATKPLTWNSYDTATKTTETHFYTGPESSVAQLCATAMRSAMPTFSGGTLRIAGFSLGAQVAAACADVIYQQPDHPAKPTLAVLLEPAFTAQLKPWSAMPLHPCSPAFLPDKKQTVKWTVQAVERLSRHNVTMALYKTSLMTRANGLSGLIFDPGTDLDVLGTLVRWNPTICGSDLNLPCQHDLIVPFYFFGLRDAYPMENLGPTSGQCKIPGPSCTDAEIHDMAIQRKALLTESYQPLWKQVQGVGTWPLEDDVFRWDTSEDPNVPLSVVYRRRYDLHGLMFAGSDSLTGWMLPILFGFAMLACLVFSGMRRHPGPFVSIPIDGDE